jgi:hypothetical protein
VFSLHVAMSQVRPGKGRLAKVAGQRTLPLRPGMQESMSLEILMPRKATLADQTLKRLVGGLDWLRKGHFGDEEGRGLGIPARSISAGYGPLTPSAPTVISCLLNSHRLSAAAISSYQLSPPHCHPFRLTQRIDSPAWAAPDAPATSTRYTLA